MTRDELKKRKIAVLAGGTSAEREVSLRTGTAVFESLLRSGYDAVMIDAGRDLAIRLHEENIEAAFIALHGRHGEDGTVQGLLEMMGIPYTGSGVLASSVAMNKVTTKELLLHHELPTPAFTVFRRGDDLDALVKATCQFPVVVKPAREGSTLGVAIADTAEELVRGVEEALVLDNLLLVEEFIAGRELTAGVLGDAPLPVIEVAPKKGFYDYEAKYTAGQTEYLLPAPLNEKLYNQVQAIALEVCRVLGCRGAARVDFMLRGEEVFCLEVNTIPGMTETSLLPKAAQQAGISFDELVLRLLEEAALDK